MVNGIQFSKANARIVEVKNVLQNYLRQYVEDHRDVKEDVVTQRHRFFETNFPLEAPAKCDHSEIPLLVTTASKASRELRFKLGMRPKTADNAPLAYGIDWLTFSELKEAIPPAYTQFIGEQMKQHLVT